VDEGPQAQRQRRRRAPADQQRVLTGPSTPKSCSRRVADAARAGLRRRRRRSAIGWAICPPRASWRPARRDRSAPG
jgi:hypothetical protein